MLSQLLVGGRDTIAGVGSWPARVATVAVGGGRRHAPATCGGWADDLLSMLANIFLVMPALPLLIVIFGFLVPAGQPTTC